MRAASEPENETRREKDEERELRARQKEGENQGYTGIRERPILLYYRERDRRE
jgi:hypothetical protein